VPYLSASAVVINYEEALYQVHMDLSEASNNLTFSFAVCAGYVRYQHFNILGTSIWIHKHQIESHI